MDWLAWLLLVATLPLWGTAILVFVALALLAIVLPWFALIDLILNWRSDTRGQP